MTMGFEIEGIVEKIYDIEKKTETFQTREFVIRTEDAYPQFIKFQTTQDKCNIVDACSVGDKIKVYFDLRGREWQGKYFTNLNAWRLEKVENAPSDTKDDFPSLDQPSFDDIDDFRDSASGGDTNDFDDLPF